MPDVALPRPDDATVWRWVAEERLALADRLADLSPSAWDRPSLCAGWQVRDVVGHLVWLAEGTRPSIFLDSLRQLRTVNAGLARIAHREGAADPPDLVARLRRAADGRFVIPGLGPTVALGEILLHGSDALRGADVPPRPADERTGVTAAAYRRLGRVFGARGGAKVRFTATDAGWSIGPEDGPTAEGPGEAVLVAVAGRPEGVADLTGPGTALLRR